MSVKPTHHYLDFTRKYRRGTFVLLAVILMICAVPFVYPLIVKPPAISVKMDASLAALQTKRSASNKNYTDDPGENARPYEQPSHYRSAYTYRKKGELFYFDPNTISAEGWKKLGLKDKTVATIMNFRSKGGQFKQAADIKKIWGLFPDEAERLMPYITIAAKAQPSFEKNYPNEFPGNKKDRRKSYSLININDADTIAWNALPGIGNKLSQRIVSFRDKLGGFYTVDQVAETFGLADSVFQKIKPYLQVSGEVQKININTATIDQLKAHPYIRYNIGNILIRYREQHGPYKNIADIKKIMIVTEEIFNKLSPYLSVE